MSEKHFRLGTRTLSRGGVSTPSRMKAVFVFLIAGGRLIIPIDGDRGERAGRRALWKHIAALTRVDCVDKNYILEVGGRQADKG
jgi:hypothetical protein